MSYVSVIKLRSLGHADGAVSRGTHLYDSPFPATVLLAITADFLRVSFLLCKVPSLSLYQYVDQDAQQSPFTISRAHHASIIKHMYRMIIFQRIRASTVLLPGFSCITEHGREPLRSSTPHDRSAHERWAVAGYCYSLPLERTNAAQSPIKIQQSERLSLRQPIHWFS